MLGIHYLNINFGVYLRRIDIETCIKDQEYNLAKFKFVQSNFPNAKIYKNYDPLSRRSYNVQFISKSVNNNYSKLDFFEHYQTLYAVPTAVLHFSFIQGDVEKKEEIIIGGIPKLNKLASIRYDYENKDKKIVFSRFVYNMKKHDFEDSIFNSCRSAIMKFVQSHPGIQLDGKHLETRLKKLLIFT